MVLYDRYFLFAKKAAEISLSNQIIMYPIHPVILAKQNGVKILTYEQFGDISGKCRADLLRISPDGFTLYKDGVHLIVYNMGVRSEGRRRWTLIHELSHILLGHISPDCPQMSALPLKEKALLELDANDLTANLIAPLSIAHLCYTETESEMKELFGLSTEAARNRLRSLNEVRRKNSIGHFLFPESVSSCLPFIANRLCVKYNLAENKKNRAISIECT